MTATTIEISKEYLHFAAAHFTIFSATERENLHGHNFHVALSVDAEIGDGGLTFDYNILKTAAKTLCDELDERVLMPSESPHLDIDQTEDYTYVTFNGERLPFLPRDILLLPVRNITVEELARYILHTLKDRLDLNELKVSAMRIKCSSGEGQWADARWPA